MPRSGDTPRAIVIDILASGVLGILLAGRRVAPGTAAAREDPGVHR